ncbi:MAG: hypothetical protein RLZZ480_837 [Candidatus Parcubacteria bacterium]
MSLKVLGVGQPRTGTNTLKCALDILGFGPCYHMYRLIEEHPEEITYFKDARDGKPVRWEHLFSKCPSGVDFPISLFYESLLTEYPNTKFILTTRDAEAWHKSISATVFKASQPTPTKMLQTLIQAIYTPSVRKRLPVLAYAGRMIKEFYGPDLTNKETVLQKFHAWNERVTHTIPASQLLIYDVKNGWEPLCAFLGVPIPDTPFPVTNSTREFQERAHLTP